MAAAATAAAAALGAAAVTSAMAAAAAAACSKRIGESVVCAHTALTNPKGERGGSGEVVMASEVVR
jgi:hypothetical protein